MTLPAFAYVAPKSLPEAIEALASLGPEAKLLAGGQSLIPLLSMRLARPTALIDLGRLVELRYVRVDAAVLRSGAAVLCIGALTRHRDVEHSPIIRAHAPLLADAAGLIGHSHIRNRGTIGGSLAHADPAAELPAAIVALDGRVIARGPDGEREIDTQHLFVGPLTTSLDPGEILTEVRVPVPPAGHGWAFREFSVRSGDFALVSACALVTPGGPARAAACRLVIGGVGSVPQRCPTAEALVAARAPDIDTARAAADLAADEIEIMDDPQVSARYRRRLVRVLARDALIDAFARLARASDVSR